MLPGKTQRHILAIETSCDETSAAVLAFPKNYKLKTINHTLRSHIVSSQVKLHAKYGGVVPMLAAREQQKNIEPVISETLHAAQLQLRDIDYFAVTRGPGLIPSLHVGVNWARAIAFSMQKPLIGINHLEGHVYSNWLPPKEISGFGFRVSDQSRIPKPKTYNLKSITFPVLNLIVSGGHTELVLMTGHGKYTLIGETLDDAAGEAFDKVARMLGLPYPGGPALAKLAEKGNPAAFSFPRPMLKSKDFNFSFSGLKTAVLYKLQDLQLTTNDKQQVADHNLKAISYQLKADLCASFQQAVVDVLVEKTIRAAQQYNVKGVFVSGGVSANKKLRETLAERVTNNLSGVEYRYPDFAYTGDNAAMIAMAAYFTLTHNKRRTANNKWLEVVADANLRLA